jgi:hypothetical protein
MALTFFLFMGALVLIFGIGFVIVTLRHHRKVDLEAREKKRLEMLAQISSERHI